MMIVVFCISSPADPNTTSSIVSTKDDLFFFIFVLSFERDRYGNFDSRRQWKEKFQWITCTLVGFAFRHLPGCLSKESLCGKRVDSSNFLRPSVDFGLIFKT